MSAPVRFACPCCDNLALPQQPPGTYYICETCRWEDDRVQFDDPDFRGGANTTSLNECRAAYQLSTALNRSLPAQNRCEAIVRLSRLRGRDTLDALLKLGAEQREDELILRAAGTALANALDAGAALSEWDIRDLTRPAAEAFFSAEVGHE